ncbi:MAG TPA: hypothetical protein VKD90_15975 [Gemmataceae bacterium]|nr:hypothetical protein [Gemmataceae bacterium]
MSDEQTDPRDPKTESVEEAAIIAAAEQARQAAAEGRVYTLEEVREELAIWTAIRRAERELDAGQGIPHEDVERRITGSGST